MKNFSGKNVWRNKERELKVNVICKLTSLGILIKYIQMYCNNQKLM